MEIFWNTIAQYNEATWWAQFLITAAGILLTTQLYRKPTLWAKRSMKIYMVFLNGWISIVYYMMYCGARGHHHILAIFWGVIAVLWLWDLFTGYTPFERNPKYKVLVGVLYAMPFLYPLLSWARGMEFPMMTTTVMPCSVAVFTIGLLLALVTRPRQVLTPGYHVTCKRNQLPLPRTKSQPHLGTDENTVCIQRTLDIEPFRCAAHKLKSRLA